MKYIPEPFKIKMVEPIKVTTEEERRGLIAAADYNAFSLKAEDVYIDLLTDSGTGAMSDAQWAAMLMGDESYSGGRSYYQLIDTAKEIFGYEYIQPVHQGRAAEKVLFPVLVERPGQTVIANTFFDTTRAHVGLAGGRPIDCVCPEGLDSALDAPFKGNMDIATLEATIADLGVDNVAGIVMTITNNSVGGQPVSMASADFIRSRMSPASLANRIESSFEVVTTWPWRRVKAPRQVLRQASTSASSSGQARCCVSSFATASRCSAVSRLSHPSTLRVGRSWPSCAREKWAKLICRSSPSP